MHDGGMEMNKFKSAIGLIILALSIVAAIASYILQAKLEEWRSFDSGNVLHYVGSDMWLLIPIIYIICLSFGLIGIYIMYEADVFTE
jgi:hypothetical protein